jgi:hypothetical protein
MTEIPKSLFEEAVGYATKGGTEVITAKQRKLFDEYLVDHGVDGSKTSIDTSTGKTVITITDSSYVNVFKEPESFSTPGKKLREDRVASLALYDYFLKNGKKDGSFTADSIWAAYHKDASSKNSAAEKQNSVISSEGAHNSDATPDKKDTAKTILVPEKYLTNDMLNAAGFKQFLLDSKIATKEDTDGFGNSKDPNNTTINQTNHAAMLKKLGPNWNKAVFAYINSQGKAPIGNFDDFTQTVLAALSAHDQSGKLVATKQQDGSYAVSKEDLIAKGIIANPKQQQPGSGSGAEQPQPPPVKK